MRILVANANTTVAISELCAAAGRAVAAPGTEILPATPRFGAAAISTRAENIIAGHALLELLAEHAGQVDAVVLAVSHDTALEAARQIMPCPVLGMTEAACLTACMVGARFGLVTLGGVETYRELVGRHGLSGRLAALEGVAATPQDAVREPERVRALVAESIARMVAQGADSVILGGAALAGMAARIPDSPVPLLDGIACAVKLAEAMVGLGLPKASAGSMAPPRGRQVSGVSPALESLLR
ncbi:aspartate/glutamate racemase family protein [Roseomonas sp. GC11]|uniref:aspartate/glutamate racemase family protein n=1 Tax=Roseomonas sp. GC11 TaxID=2950546 RepID=UPI0021086EE2|nr:aspartate/glutamate racemase family protein [Roseomonas sp. GC11]MCQ4158573.1 aspartate/glutamate racemase family protein [Roseomonas sp. GC11]